LLYDPAATMYGWVEPVPRVCELLNGGPQCHRLSADGPTTQPERCHVVRWNVDAHTAWLCVAAEM